MYKRAFVGGVFACGLLVLGCGEDSEDAGPGSGGATNTGGSAGAGGSAAAGGSGGTAGVPSKGELVTIEPGGDTICSRGTPFRFFVAGGDPEKIVIDFRGGGACWNAITCSISDAIFSPEAPTEMEIAAALGGGASGIYRLDDPKNPVAGWSLVHIPYCTGDIHWGDAVKDYAPDLKIHHKGFVNTKSVLDWVFARYQPKEVLITGCSAGAYGAIGHAPYVADQYPNAKITVIADSGCGVVSDSFFKDSFPNWNAQIPQQVPDLKGKDITTLTIVDLYVGIGKHYPNMRIAEQTAAFDKDQTSYFQVMGGDPADFTGKVQKSLADISAGTPNIRYFLSPGPLHCLLPYASMYDRKSEGTPYLTWMDGMLNGATAPPSVGCTATSCKTDPVCDACKAGSGLPECSWCEGWTGQ